MNAVDDIVMLRTEQGRSSASIDWDRVLTINYRSYVYPDALVVDAGAGEALQSRRLRRYARPSQLFLVESDPKAAAKLRFQWARKRGITVVQVALGAETVEGDDIDIDRLDDWTLPGPLSFLRVGRGNGPDGVLAGAANIIDRDRPTIGLEGFPNPATLTTVATRYDLSVLDLLGNVVKTEDAPDVFAYQPGAILLPTERVEQRGQDQVILRADVLRSIATYRPSLEHIKRWFGV